MIEYFPFMLPTHVQSSTHYGPLSKVRVCPEHLQLWPPKQKEKHIHLPMNQIFTLQIRGLDGRNMKYYLCALQYTCMLPMCIASLSLYCKCVLHMCQLHRESLYCLFEISPRRNIPSCFLTAPNLPEHRNFLHFLIFNPHWVLYSSLSFGFKDL